MVKPPAPGRTAKTQSTTRADTRIRKKLRSCAQKSKRVWKILRGLDNSKTRTVQVGPERSYKDYVPRLHPNTVGSPFADLPAELHLEVGQWLLSSKDILQVALTCQKLKEIYGKKSLYLQMAETFRTTDVSGLVRSNFSSLEEEEEWEEQGLEIIATYSRLVDDSYQKANYKPQLCNLSKFLFRQCHSSGTTRWALTDILSSLVAGNDEILEECLVVIKEISETLGKRINDYPEYCREIRCCLLRRNNLDLLDLVVTNGLVLSSGSCSNSCHLKPLHDAIVTNNLPSVIFLLRHGFSASEPSNTGGNPPIYDALATYPSVSADYRGCYVKLDRIEDANDISSYVDTKIRIIKILIAAGADPQCIQLGADKNPLIDLFSIYDLAAKQFEYLTVFIPKILRPRPISQIDTASNLDSCTDVHLPEFDSPTIDAVEINIDINAIYQSKQLPNPLDFLVSPMGYKTYKIHVSTQKRLFLLDTFLAAGLDPDTRNREGLTALQVAILQLASTFFDSATSRAASKEKTFRHKAVKLLLQYGAGQLDERIPAVGNFTIIEVAAALREKQILKMLVGIEKAKRWIANLEDPALPAMEGFETHCKTMGKEAVVLMVIQRVRTWIQSVV